ncbi:type I glyceraldehyde-3-phosphate dehydrogenase [Pelagibaculum spongiae]|uniref:Erythrose-4-phosphate dehydrogenase n=1 Tax=Pelagibaculum spongiae TaxID=2080658 RepID=A0A2V1GYH0_9GAMM|nr:glyceraldehyde 3-phosphate dehydrogenase NAD-binding domain-containing protein [Pelagibaculum spongiae]PVZ72141.1 erythrose-4-phosphate dehydrogenase [Pelagibaculum spongiae]
MLRLAINGYGRIGRCVLRALYENGAREQMQLVAINELAPVQSIDYLTRFDSTHGRFPGDVKQQDGRLIVNGDSIRLLHEADPSALPWQELDVDLVLECSGRFDTRAACELHIQAGAKKVLLSNPGASDADMDATVVYGVNHPVVRSEHTIVSAASCTTNCLVPILDLLDREWGIEHGSVTTLHSAMNDQPVIDAFHHDDLRRNRGAGHSIIPVDTGLAKGVARILPQLEGKLESSHLRFPTINVSAMDIVLRTRSETSLEQVNQLLAKAAAQGPLKGLLGFSNEPLASCDFNHDPRSTIVDATQTRVNGGRLIKMLAWFDNEWAYASRMLDVANLMRKC